MKRCSAPCVQNINKVDYFLSTSNKCIQGMAGISFAICRKESIERLDDNVFPTIQNTETCIVSWNSNHTGDAKIQYKDGTVVHKNLNKDTVIKFNNPNFVYEVDNNLAHRWLRGKVSRSSLIEGDLPIVEICGKGETPVIKNIQRGLEDTARNCHGVVMNINMSHVTLQTESPA